MLRGHQEHLEEYVALFGSRAGLFPRSQNQRRRPRQLRRRTRNSEAGVNTAASEAGINTADLINLERRERPAPTPAPTVEDMGGGEAAAAAAPSGNRYMGLTVERLNTEIQNAQELLLDGLAWN